MFHVTLIDVKNLPYVEAFNYLKDNCTFVDKNIWIMDGDIANLFDKGVGFVVLAEGKVPSLGGLNRKELIAICDEHLGVKV